VDDGVRYYCEQGEDGHYGTCCGNRSQEEYDRLVAEVVGPESQFDTREEEAER
jgi:hypothetical protein